MQRFLNDKNVAQPCPATEKLQLAFTTEVRRIQRRSDGTLTLEGIRFEVPSRFGHLPRTLAALRFLGLEHGLSGRSENRRHPLPHLSAWTKRKMPKACARPEPPRPVHHRRSPPPGMAPLLQKIIQQYATTGLPPAYLPQPQNPQNPS